MSDAEASDGIERDRRRYHFDYREVFEKEWVTVFDGGLSRPIDVKVQMQGGRVRVVGLRIDDGATVTTRRLREPRISELEARFDEWLQDRREDLALIRARVERGDEEMELIAFEDIARWERELTEAIDRISALQEPGTPAFRSRGRGAAAPSAADYVAFSKLYLEHRRRTSKRGTAIVATARDAGMNRSTVYRWLRECQERGFVPQEVQE